MGTLSTGWATSGAYIEERRQLEHDLREVRQMQDHARRWEVKLNDQLQMLCREMLGQEV